MTLNLIHTQTQDWFHRQISSIHTHTHNAERTAEQLLHRAKQSNGRLDTNVVQVHYNQLLFRWTQCRPWVDMPRKEMREESKICPGTKCAVSLLHKYFVNVYTRPIQTKAFNVWFIYSFLLVCFLTSALSPSHTLAFDALLLFYERTPKENKNK